MKKQILVTGASGFIGKHAAAALSGRHRVLTPTHTQLDLLDEDNVRTYFRKHTIDIVVHCAVVGGNRTEEYVKGMFYDNVRMFFNLARCHRYFGRMINIGSGAEYDKRLPIVRVKEDDLGKRIPADEYGLYKYICAQYINTSANIVDLRVFGMFGAGEKYQYRFISNAICRYVFNMPITMNQDVYFDYMDIKDFMKIIGYFVTHKPKYRAYNIGSGRRVSLIQLANHINRLDSYRVNIAVKKPGLNNEYTGNVKRLFKEIPGLKITPMPRSIRNLFDWYKKNIRSIHRSELV